jgi:hypothetical protein
VASGEPCSRGRAQGTSVRQRPPAVRKSGQQISSREEIPSREVGVCPIMLGAEGDWSAGSGPSVVVVVPDLGEEDHFLARTIRGIAYVEDVEPVAAKVTLELVAFAKAQGRGRSHDLLADGGRSLKGHEGERDLGHGA